MQTGEALVPSEGDGITGEHLQVSLPDPRQLQIQYIVFKFVPGEGDGVTSEHLQVSLPDPRQLQIQYIVFKFL